MYVASDLFKRGMRRLASGVSLITTIDDGAPHGLVATSVSSVSGDPPSLLVCVNQSASSYRPLMNTGFFCVSVLSEADEGVARAFGSKDQRDARFRGRQWATLVTGAPALVGSLASFDCRVSKTVDYETHTIFIADIAAIELWSPEIEPLLYLDGGFRTLPAPALPPAE